MSSEQDRELLEMPGSAHKDECPVKLARVFCEAVVKHMFQDTNRHGRLTLDVEAFLSEVNTMRDAGFTRAAAALAKGEGKV